MKHCSILALNVLCCANWSAALRKGAEERDECYGI